MVEVRLHQRRDDDGSLREHGLDVLEGHVADHVRLDEVADRGEAHAELPRGAPGELLHPAHAQAQRLAEDPVVVAALGVATQVHGGRLRRQLGTRSDARRRQCEHDRAALQHLLDR